MGEEPEVRVKAVTEVTRTYTMTEEHVAEACIAWLKAKNYALGNAPDVAFISNSYGDFREAVITTKTREESNDQR